MCEVDTGFASSRTPTLDFVNNRQMTGSSTFSIAWNGEEYCIFRIRFFAALALRYVLTLLRPLCPFSRHPLCAHSRFALSSISPALKLVFAILNEEKTANILSYLPSPLKHSRATVGRPRELARRLVLFRYFFPCSTAVQTFFMTRLTFFPACVMVFQAKRGCLLYQ